MVKIHFQVQKFKEIHPYLEGVCREDNSLVSSLIPTAQLTEIFQKVLKFFLGGRVGDGQRDPERSSKIFVL